MSVIWIKVLPYVLSVTFFIPKLFEVNDLWMDVMRFYVLFNSISVISGLLECDNEGLCAMESRLQLK